jgi:hypothetical protein
MSTLLSDQHQAERAAIQAAADRLLAGTHCGQPASRPWSNWPPKQA